MGLCNCKKPCTSTDYDVNYNSADNGFDLPVFDLIFSRDYEMTLHEEWEDDDTENETNKKQKARS